MTTKHNFANLNSRSTPSIQANNKAPIASTAQPKTIFPDAVSAHTIIAAIINKIIIQNISCLKQYTHVSQYAIRFELTVCSLM